MPSRPPASTEPDRPRLLFLGQSVPYPIDSGAHIRSFHTLRLLASAFDTTAIFFHRRAARPVGSLEASLDGVRSIEGVRSAYAVPIPQEESRLRFVWDHARSVAGGRVYTTFVYDSAALERRLDEVDDRHPPDLVHIDTLDLAAHVPRYLGRVPVACSHHNLESLLLRRRAELTRQPLRRAYLRRQAALARREERRWIPHLSVNLVVSETERRSFLDTVGHARYEVIPNCVDTARFAPTRGAAREGVVFLGGHGWEPNRDAMEHFCSRILPVVRRSEPDCPVTWLAKADEATCAELSRRYDITVLGYVDEIRPLIERAACYVVPLRIGGGTRLKIVEAWAMGSAVVSTSIGAEGLDATHGQDILLADDVEGFAAHVVAVLRDPALRDRLGTAARRTAVARYDWDVYRDRLVGLYRGLLSSRHDDDPGRERPPAGGRAPEPW